MLKPEAVEVEVVIAAGEIDDFPDPGLADLDVVAGGRGLFHHRNGTEWRWHDHLPGSYRCQQWNRPLHLREEHDIARRVVRHSVTKDDGQGAL